MAYAASVTVVRSGTDVVVTISETECAAASEATINLGVQHFRIHRQLVALTAGTGTTIDPVIGTDSNPAGNSLLLANGDPAAAVDNSLTGGVACYDPNGTLFHRSQPSAGTDNAVSTTYLITCGF